VAAGGSRLWQPIVAAADPIPGQLMLARGREVKRETALTE
jgi:hypothetical protein